ncbi:hypothetical protein ACE1CD_25375 [Aerosakkonema sp. BLCC-F183]|uniref:hypothetical protein n=1 Tax=Aerosakkonema sp. BLCC-F183 TaxID=3342834 RepID=UPI0035BA9701
MGNVELCDRTLPTITVRSHIDLLVLNSGMGRYALPAGYANAYSTVPQSAFHNSKHQTGTRRIEKGDKYTPVAL